MKAPIFRGVATALVTPFSDGDIDFPALDRLLALQIDAGIPALVITGTTGEASTLTKEEKAQLWMHCVDFADGSCKIIAGIGTNCTKASIELAQSAEVCGVDALLAVTPYYNRCTQRGLISHYTAIADSTSLPLITYNVPARTGIDMSVESCKLLSKHPRINGIKEAGGNLSKIAHILADSGMYLWSGNDHQIVAAMSMGAIGVISVLSNLCPDAVRRITEECEQSNYAEASKLQLSYLPLIDQLFSEVNPIPIKAALSAKGLCKNELRMPLTPLSVSAQISLYEAMEQCLA